MSPEISKKCLQCGAAVHPQALFCPECGRPAGDESRLKEGAGDAEDEVASTIDAAEEPKDPPAPVTDKAAESDPEVSHDLAVEPEVEPPAPVEDPLAEHLAALKAQAEAASPAGATAAAAAPKTTAPLRRRSSTSQRSTPGRTTPGRSVYSKLPAVKLPPRMRGVGGDPALRFLLVTAGLVIFALVAFILSRYLH